MAWLASSPISVPAASPVVSAMNSPITEHSTALTSHPGAIVSPSWCTPAPRSKVTSGDTSSSRPSILRT